MSERANVPCNGCIACCKHEIIVLHPEHGDVVSTYEHTMKVNPLSGKVEPVLKRKPNGECIYLGDKGCTIHDRAPAICREFDCRRLYLKFDRAARRRLIRNGLFEKDVIAAGARLVEAEALAEKARASA